MNHKTTRTATHWGAYDVEVSGNDITAIRPVAGDLDPSPIGQSYIGIHSAANRIKQPMVRSGWLEHGPTARLGQRGGEPFVAMSWERAIDLVASEMRRVRKLYGDSAIYAGSYGWASAGRFHHAQSQIHRFMNLAGGYTSSVNSYSLAAAEVIMPHVVGMPWWTLYSQMTDWSVIAQHTDLMVCFGGVPLKNAQVSAGGTGRHTTKYWVERAFANGTRFVSISPLRADMPGELDAEWLPARPCTDVALMLGLAHCLLTESLYNQAFIERYTVGFDRFREYLLGRADGIEKHLAWASERCGLPAATLRSLAHRMATARTMINVAWSLQRGEHGEQTFWMATVLAAMIGQIGLAGGGVGYGYGATNGAGNPARRLSGPRLPQGDNPVNRFIPVARIADMLLSPGCAFSYDGHDYRYPDIRLVYWAGGNPFHHHQDLNKLLRAWSRPETIVVHEPWWNASARHADIVLPTTTTLERDDIGSSSGDAFLIAMQRAVAPPPGCLDDYTIFSRLAERSGFGSAFTEGRSAAQWLEHLYEISRLSSREAGVEFPAFDEFWQAGEFEIPPPDQPSVLFSAFRQDPTRSPLPTPSGRIEIFSATVAGFGYADCLGHPTWFEPIEYLGSNCARRMPLHLTSNQPGTRLHSQLDHGSVSLASKIQGREPLLMHPSDASARNLQDGDVVRVFNDRGACLAGLRISDDIRPQVVQLATGAWYDPIHPGEVGSLDVHGNPNVLTADRPTSQLAQGPTAHSTLVDVERWTEALPALQVHAPPPILSLKDDGP